MSEYGFEENVDFTVMDIFVHNSLGGRQNQSDHTKERGVVKHDVIDSLGRNQELPKHRWSVDI